MADATRRKRKTPAEAGAPGFNRSLLPWYVIEALHAFAVGTFSNGLYFFLADKLHKSVTMDLWLVACGGTMYVPAAMIGGKIADRFGARRVMIFMAIATIVTSLFALVGVYQREVFPLFVALALFVLFSTPMWPALESALSRSPGNMKMPKRMSIYNIMWSLGVFVAIAAGGSIAMALTWPGVFYSAAAASLLNVFLLWFWALPDARIAAHQADTQATAHNAEQFENVAGRHRAKILLWMAWIANPMAWVGVSVLLALMPHLAAAAGIAGSAAATALASVWSLSRTVGFAIDWFWSGWHYKVRWLLGSYVVMAVSLLTLLLNHSLAAMLIGQVAFGLSAALLYAASLYYAMHVSSGAGQHAGLHEAILGIGTAVGPAVAALAGGPYAVTPKAIAVAAMLAAGGAALVILSAQANAPPHYRRSETGEP